MTVCARDTTPMIPPQTVLNPRENVWFSIAVFHPLAALV